jgi:hypothetical protein
LPRNSEGDQWRRIKKNSIGKDFSTPVVIPATQKVEVGGYAADLGKARGPT